MNNLEMELSELALIELKRLLYRHREEIIEDLQLEGAISCPECIMGNCESFCYRIVVDVANVITMSVIIVK